MASGTYSACFGVGSTATGWGSFACGNYGKASADSSFAANSGKASGDRSAAFGYANASGTESFAAGPSSSVASGMYSAAFCGGKSTGTHSFAAGNWAKALNYQVAIGTYNNTNTATAASAYGTGTGTIFVIGNGVADTASQMSNAFRVNANGQAFGKASYTTSGADYAEFFEWQDGNPDNEDRRGYFVTLEADKIKIANKGDYILGIISGLPSVIGNGDEDWMGRYIMDEFGDFVYEDFEEEIVVGYEYETPEIDPVEHAHKSREEKLKIIEPVKKEIKETIRGKRYKQNPDYDPTREYIQRQDRPEWDAVGMLGVLSVRDNGECQVNGYCELVDGGTVVPSETGYRVIKRVSDNVVKIVFK
jgi:hypothetical protein